MHHVIRAGFAVFLLGVLLSAGFAHPTWADDQTPPSTSPPPAASDAHKRGREMIKQACGDDVKRFCQEVKPGGGRIVQCLEEHAKDLSQDCSKLMEKRAQKKIAQPKTSQ